MNGLRGACPAKLNLTLAVTGRREDGYHALRSVFLRTTLHDELEVRHRHESGGSADGGLDLLAVDGAADLTSDDNLVLRAAQALREAAAEPLPALRFRLTKRIPVAAGLGGGSSDAATALDLASRMWGLDLDDHERHAIALRLGADVPYFLAGHAAALVEGIGEAVRPLPALTGPAGVLLVTPRERLSTAAVFDDLDRGAPPTTASREATDELASALAAGLDGLGLVEFAPLLSGANDLWVPAARLAPGLAVARSSLVASLQRPVLLSGSGPTLFAIYASPAAAVAAAEALEAERPPQLDGATIIATTSQEGAHA